MAGWDLPSTLLTPKIYQNTGPDLQQSGRLFYSLAVQASVVPFCETGTPSHPSSLLTAGTDPGGPLQAQESAVKYGCAEG